jgi:hypothetical protein
MRVTLGWADDDRSAAESEVLVPVLVHVPGHYNGSRVFSRSAKLRVRIDLLLSAPVYMPGCAAGLSVAVTGRS